MSEPIAVRASSWGDLFDCAHRWEGKYILGMNMPSSGAAALGTAIHASTAMYDDSRMRGVGLTVDDCAGELIRNIVYPDQDVVWDEPRDKMEAIGLRLHTNYCMDWSPKFDFVGVEMALESMDVEAEGITVRLTGTMDRARAVRGQGHGIKDLKSGKRAVDADGRANTKGHAAQLGVYELLFEHTTGLEITAPGEIIGLKTSGDCSIGTATVPNAKQRMTGAPGESGLLEMGAKMLKSGLFPPNPRSQLCSPRYCPRWDSCLFHD